MPDPTPDVFLWIVRDPEDRTLFTFPLTVWQGPVPPSWHEREQPYNSGWWDEEGRAEYQLSLPLEFVPDMQPGEVRKVTALVTEPAEVSA